VYNLIFSHIRYKELVIGEVGILDNNSMLCWREYFPNALLFGYEYHQNKLDKAVNDKVDRASYIHVDITSEQSLNNVFSDINFFDIIIEDSTHVFEDQIRFLNIAYKCVKPGGTIVIEDIFIKEDENRYMEAIDHIKEYFSSATFVLANHDLKFSPGWDNDKLLILHRNDKPCS
jgi:SAM-dependent methyltransferase